MLSPSKLKVKSLIYCLLCRLFLFGHFFLAQKWTLLTHIEASEWKNHETLSYAEKNNNLTLFFCIFHWPCRFDASGSNHLAVWQTLLFQWSTLENPRLFLKFPCNFFFLWFECSIIYANITPGRNLGLIDFAKLQKRILIIVVKVWTFKLIWCVVHSYIRLSLCCQEKWE